MIVNGNDVTGTNVLKAVEPERAHQVQDSTLVRDTIRHDHVKRGNPVGGNDKELVTEIVQLANFVVPLWREETGNRRRKQGGHNTDYDGCKAAVEVDCARRRDLCLGFGGAPVAHIRRKGACAKLDRRTSSSFSEDHLCN